MHSGLDRYVILDKAIRISNSTVDVERRLKNLLQLFRRDMGSETACLFNLDREAWVLTLRATDAESPAPDLKLNLNDNFIGAAALKREPVLTGPEGFERLPEACAAIFKTPGFGAAFPIMDDQVLYGVLALLHRDQEGFTPERIGLIQGLGLEMAGTIRNSRLYVESKKRIAELSVLFEVARAVSSTINLGKILDTVVNITCKVLVAEGCALNVMDVAENDLKIAAEYGIIPPSCRFRRFLEPGAGPIPRDVLDCVSRKSAYVGPAAHDVHCRPMRSEGGAKSVICLPLHFKGALKGTLSVYNRIPTPTTGRAAAEFNREDLELLGAMGAMISSSLENALSFQAVDRLAKNNELLVKNLSLLYEISGAMMTTVKLDELLAIITNALTLGQSLGFDRAFILLMNEEEDALTGAAIREVRPETRIDNGAGLSDQLRDLPEPDEVLSRAGMDYLKVKLPLDQREGILVHAALQNHPFNITSENGRPNPGLPVPKEFGKFAFAAVPMTAKGKVVGVIAVDRDFSRREITDEDMRNLSMLANQAGLAIENSRLYEYIEHANSELSQTRERLLEAEKLAALGEMAAGMAHEIRNPLVSIGGFTRRLLKNLDPKSPHKVYVEVIINEVSRLEKTLSEVLDFSRDTLGHMAEYNLNDVVSEALYVLRRDFREGGIDIVKELTEAPRVYIDERQIKHVFFNLFFNASQAMPKGGTLTVRTYMVREDDRAFVACEVADTGPGIDPVVLPNIFNPFFTTKDAGTGLGLSIVHKIVSRHHGLIDVLNNESRGAVFIVKLPVAAEAGLYLR
ncbi:MAG: GAF domain-containing protein [Pseudomonadota bacterium]